MYQAGAFQRMPTITGTTNLDFVVALSASGSYDARNGTATAPDLLACTTQFDT